MSSELSEQAPSNPGPPDFLAGLQALFAAAPQMMGIGEVDGEQLITVSANQATADYIQQPLASIVGQSTSERGTSPDIVALWLDRIRESARLGAPVRFEYQDDRYDAAVWLDATVVALGTTPEGRLRYSFVVEDVSDRHRSEVFLRASEERYRTLFNSIDQGFCTIEVLFDEEGVAIDYRFIEINPSFARNTGLDETAIGQRMRELAPDHEPYWYDIYGRIALSREPVRFEAEAAALGRWYNVYAYPVGEPAEHKVAVLFEDITERRAALTALQESELRFRTLIQNLPDYAIFLLDRAGIITEWSEGAERITGYQSEDVLGQHMSMLYPEEDVAAGEPDRELAAAAREGRAEREGWHQRKDGSRYWGNEIATAVYDAWGNLSGYTKISRDLTAQRRAEELLLDSEERARAIVEAATDYAIFTVSADARIQDWFAGAEAVFGWRADEAVGQPFAITFTPEDRAQGTPQRELQQAEKNGSAPDVRWHQHKDGSRVFIDGVVHARSDLAGTFLGALKIGQDVTDRRLEAEQRLEHEQEMRRELQAQVAVATAELRALSRRLLLVQEEERRYLARELHDEIGQVLTGLALSLSMGTMTGEQRTDAQRLVAELTEQVRQLSMDLRPAALDAYGVLPALRGHIERYEARTGIMVELRTEGLERRFPAPVEITVYRIAQEALTNMARHSGTQHAVMQLLADDRTLAVSIRDTGRGFDPLAVKEGSGLGGMRERAELLGGTLDIDAVPGGGVTITAELPLSPESEDELS